MLEAIAALHDTLPQPGPLSLEREANEMAGVVRSADVRRAPTPEWLLRVGLNTLDLVDGSTALVAEGLEVRPAR
jgi:hypothetical protein